MFKDPVLFHRWGTDWPLTKCFFASGVFLIILAFAQVWVLFRHNRVRSRRLSSAEAGDVALNPAPSAGSLRPQRSIGPAVGRSIEMSVGIDDLRQAARRGDWITFWL